MTKREKIVGFFAKLLDIIFPPTCVLCKNAPAREERICSDCAETFRREAFDKCVRCGGNALRCTCRTGYTEITKTAVDGRTCCVLTFYRAGENRSERVTERMIYSLKERGEFADFFAKELARELTRLFGKDGIREWIVTYPPRSPAKYKKYGFDQCELLSRRLADRLGIERAELFVRDSGEEQKSLSAQEREVNADTTLVVDRSAVKKGGKYIVVDDIITTGATMNAVARNLYFCGAAEVFPCAVAKTMPKKTQKF